MKLQQITSAYKNTFIDLYSKESIELALKAMYKMGFYWHGHSKGEQRHTPSGYKSYEKIQLNIDKNLEITWMPVEAKYPENLNYRKIGFEGLIADSKLFVETKKKNHREKQLLKKIANTEFNHYNAKKDKMPNLHPTTMVEVALLNGEKYVDFVKYFDWGNSLPSQRIVGWRIPKNKNGTNIFNTYSETEATVIAAPDVVAIDTNPKRQYGVSSIPISRWSSLATAYGAVAMHNGAGKYGKNNFKATKVEASIYIDAALRHLLAWAEGEEFDPKDKVPNLGGVLANVAILLEARAAGTLIDDRNIGTGYLQEREALAKLIKDLNELHKDKNPKHYTLNTTGE